MPPKTANGQNGALFFKLHTHNNMLTKADITMIRSLADKKSRTEHGLFVVEGRKMVAEALESDMKVRRVLGTEDFAGLHGCEIVSRKDIERMSSLKTTQGVMALIEIPQYTLPKDPGNELTLALDSVQDPGNMGTIIRLADWFGIRDIICSPETADCYGPKTVQATMGAIFRVKTHYENLPEVLGRAKHPVFGTFLDGENIYGAKFDGHRGIIVLGNEGNGISSAVARTVTRKLFIPPYPAGDPASESLNVGVAAAIACSEFRRRCGA